MNINSNWLILNDVLKKITIKKKMLSRFIKINLKTLITKIVRWSQGNLKIWKVYNKMDANDFVRDLNDAKELMGNEKYLDALVILNKLKEADKAGNFDYNLTHKLYQLISNSQSLYNQQRVLSVVKKISQKQMSISFIDLNEILDKQENVRLDEQVLRREVEILILRSLLECKIEGNELVFWVVLNSILKIRETFFLFDRLVKSCNLLPT